MRIGWRSEVTVLANDERRQIRSGAATVADLLDEAGIIAAPDSVISHDLESALSDGMVIEIAAARDIQVTVDGAAQTIRTALRQPLAILESAGVVADARDRVLVNGAFAGLDALDRWTAPVSAIEIRRPRQITLLDGETELRLETIAETVAAALAESGIAVNAGDTTQPPLDAPLQNDMRIVIQRATPIQLEVDGVVLELAVQAMTVREALREVDVALFGEDYALPGADSAITPGMRIQIVRVSDETIVEEETIAYQTRHVADAALPLDARSVAQMGQTGIRERRSVLRYENGVEVSRSEATVITRQPRDHVIHYGTNVALGTVNTPVGPRHYWRVLCMLATSYHPGALGGDDTTSIGWTLKRGVVAADPQIIPYRAKVYVPGYGVATMADTGGPRSSPYWIDLGYSDDDWRSWLGYVKVYLLTPAPPEIDFDLPPWTPNASRPGGCDD